MTKRDVAADTDFLLGRLIGMQMDEDVEAAAYRVAEAIDGVSVAGGFLALAFNAYELLQRAPDPAAKAAMVAAFMRLVDPARQ